MIHRRRRAVLAVMAGALSGALSGCAGMFLGLSAAPDPAEQDATGTYRLRIAIFEIGAVELPFHTGVLIDAPQGRILYDPAGVWQNDSCQRHRDVHFPIDDAAAEAWLNRGGLQGLPGRWTLHLFEADLAPDVAALAHDLALARAPALPFACALAVSSLLAQVPGFQDVRPGLLTSEMLEVLQARDDLRYTTRRVPAPEA